VNEIARHAVGASHGEIGHECDAECMEARLSARCEEPRYGMYVPNSTCGDFATHKANGKALCEVHARRARLEAKCVEPLSDEQRSGE
jgi:hypothetical protein